MNIISRLKNALSPSKEISKNISFENLAPLSWGNNFIVSNNGSNDYLNKIFYSAQNILVRKMIEAPLMFVYKKNGASTKINKFYSDSVSNEKRALIKAQSVTELENHPLNVLFDKPNEYQTGIELMEDFWHNYAFGDGYIYFENIELSRNNKPFAIHSLNRDRVTPVSSTDEFDSISHYEYITYNDTLLRIEKDNILHLKHWNPNINDLKGLGVNAIASMDISLNKANNTAQGSAFKNGGRGTLFSSDVVNDSISGVVDKMTGEQMNQLKETILRDYSGLKNYRKLHFTNGKVDVQNYGDTMAEMDLIKADDSSWKSIFTIVGVPFFLAPIDGVATYNNVQYGYKALVTNTVLPEIKKFDQKLTQKIFKWWPDITAITDVTEYSELSPDLRLMKETYGSPLLRTDELRAVFSYDAIGGEIGNAILVPSGLMKIEDIISNEFDNLTPPTTL